jgi:Ca2+-transporting ATPase
VILTDKTGTLTENVVKIQDVYPAESEAAVMAAFGGALTEMSLTATDEAVRARMKDLRVADDLGAVLRERSFDATHKTRSVLREAAGGKLTLYMSGAPEEVLEHAAGDAAGWEAEAEKQAAQGRRVIAVAERAVAAADRDADFAKLEKGLKIVGLAALADSPRAGVKAAIARALGAGVRTIMVTGDHPQTALAIARLVGIPAGGALTGADLDKLSDKELRQTVRGTAIFSRVTPEHKYRLLQALQANGEVVAVTGDGINDTLALKGADIGIAMGIKGTDAAKEAADVVLADDNYTTIAAAIFEGRKFFDNLRKGFKYYLSVKTALVLTFLLPALTGISFPFAPVQIIVLELFMDLAASSGFVAEPAERGIYHRAPRDPKTQLFDARTIVNMLTAGVSLFAAVWLSYWYASANHLSAGQAQSFAFAAWVMGHVILAFVSRSDSEPVWRLGFFSNPVIVGWAAVAFTFVTMAVMVPGVANLLKLSTLSWTQLGTVFVIALAAIGWRELFKWFGRR